MIVDVCSIDSLYNIFVCWLIGEYIGIFCLVELSSLKDIGNRRRTAGGCISDNVSVLALDKKMIEW